MLNDQFVSLECIPTFIDFTLKQPGGPYFGIKKVLHYSLTLPAMPRIPKLMTHSTADPLVKIYVVPGIPMGQDVCY